MRFHPTAQILVWSLVTVALQTLMPNVLFAASSAILLSAFLVSRYKLALLLRRTRWVMVTLLVIYSYSIPGKSLLPEMGVFSPTYEGMADGGLQLLRLLASLAALAILLERLHRDQLIAGLYVLFTPMQWLGVSRDRLAVRLSLTLHYAEAAMLRGTSDWQGALRGLMALHDDHEKEMELMKTHFGVSDAMLLLVTTFAIWLLLK